jgi:Uma2 family endonuclease
MIEAATRPKRFTWDDIEAMMRAGVLEGGGPEELLDGEIWVMAAEGAEHIDLKAWLNEQLVVRKPVGVGLACDTTFRVSDTHAPSPDFFLYQSSMRASAVRGPDALLVIEIAESSLRKDLDIKSRKYREYGVREYWVIDLPKRVTHVHLVDGDWPAPMPIPFDAPLAPAFAPDMNLLLADSGV